MPKYKGLQSLLDAALGEYLTKGFSLTEETDDFLHLFYNGERVATFTQYVSIPRLHDYCKRYLQSRAEEEALWRGMKLLGRIILDNPTDYPVSLAIIRKDMLS